MTRKSIGLAGVMIAGAALCPGANAQWTVTNLNPLVGGPFPGSSAFSIAYGVSGTRVVGEAVVATFTTNWWNGFRVAGYWGSTPESWVLLDPTGTTGAVGGDASAAFATNGVQQGGHKLYRASLWSGTAASRIDLTPDPLALASTVNALSSTQQGGAVFRASGTQASLWSGSAASWVNLHPASTGQTDSRVRGMSETQQVGETEWSGLHGPRAALWEGTAASYVSLHPPGAVQSSAYAANGTRQVGFVRPSGGSQSVYAALWSGTAASVVNLHPSGFESSVATGVHGDYQVGWVSTLTTQLRRASLWNGTAASWVNLHDLLPGGPAAWSASEATGVWTDGVTLRISGFARTLQQSPRAMLWSMTLPPACPGDWNGDGVIDFNDLLEFLNDYNAQNPRADINGDGVIDFNDLLEYLNLYNVPCD